MANKILRIPRNQLPPVESNNVYSIRFRVISEDKNRVSHWSPIFVIDSVAPVAVSGALSVTETIITAVWGDEEGRPAYDVFVNFDSGGYEYHGTTTTHQYAFLNEGISTVRVAIQISSSSKARNAGLTIWESSVTSL
jgi:hypothetical protein